MLGIKWAEEYCGRPVPFRWEEMGKEWFKSSCGTELLRETCGELRESPGRKLRSDTSHACSESRPKEIGESRGIQM